jgi:hypothetical protein
MVLSGGDEAAATERNQIEQKESIDKWSVGCYTGGTIKKDSFLYVLIYFSLGGGDTYGCPNGFDFAGCRRQLAVGKSARHKSKP